MSNKSRGAIGRGNSQGTDPDTHTRRRAGAPLSPGMDRRKTVPSPRKVSFPKTENRLVTGYLDPPDPWANLVTVNQMDIVEEYKTSCKANNTTPLNVILDHIRNLDLTVPRNQYLDLTGILLTSESCEALEALFRHQQYKRVVLAKCGLNDETATTLFDMIEYYESAEELDISENDHMGVRGWEACSQLIRKSQLLESLEAKHMHMNDMHVAQLSKSLRRGTRLTTLRLEHCGLSGYGLVTLVAALKGDSSMQVLSLANNDLNSMDAAQLCTLLRSNLHLQHLDISNNSVLDTGAGYLSEALIEQTQAINRLAVGLPGARTYTQMHTDINMPTNILDSSTPKSEDLLSIIDLGELPAKPQIGSSADRGLLALTVKRDNVELLQLFDSDNSNNSLPTSKLNATSSITELTYNQDASLMSLTGTGLKELVMWNNRLTRTSAVHLERILDRNTTLEMLNIGHNIFGNEVLQTVQEALKKNVSLLKLGMQSTHLSCDSAVALSNILKSNHTLLRIDLRDNNIQLDGLRALMAAMKINKCLTQLDLDNTPRRMVEDTTNSRVEYSKLLSQIRTACGNNEKAAHVQKVSKATTKPVTKNIHASRKISLTCHTVVRPEVCLNRSLLEPRKSGGRLRSPLPSPIPSPLSSPVPSPSRNRFHVSRVTESSPQSSTSSLGSSPLTPPSISSSPTCFFPSTSRFRVTVVESKSVNAGTNATLGFKCATSDTNISIPHVTVTTAKHMPVISPMVTVTSHDNSCTMENEINSNVFDTSLQQSNAEVIRDYSTTHINEPKTSKCPNIVSTDDNFSIPIRDIEISVKSGDKMAIDKNVSELSLDSPDFEVSRYMTSIDRSRAIFGSTSSLEASTSSMESISIDTSKQRHLTVCDLNVSLSSNDSFDDNYKHKLANIPMFNEYEFDRSKPMKMSYSSNDSSIDSYTFENSKSSNTSVDQSSDILVSKYLVKTSTNSIDGSTHSQDSLYSQNCEKVEDESDQWTMLPCSKVMNESLSSNQSTLTNIEAPHNDKVVDNVVEEMILADEERKKKIRKTSWVPPISTWTFDDLKEPNKKQQCTKLSLSTSESVLSNPTKTVEKDKVQISNAEDVKVPSSLEYLLSLFQHPGSFFMKSSGVDNQRKVSVEHPKKDAQFNLFSWATRQSEVNKECDVEIKVKSDLENIDSVVGDSAVLYNDSLARHPVNSQQPTCVPSQRGDDILSTCNQQSRLLQPSGINTNNVQCEMPTNKIHLSENSENKCTNEKRSVLTPNSSPENTFTSNNQNVTCVEHLPSKIKEQFKENISPEHTMVTNLKNKTFMLRESVEKQSSVIERVQSLVESMSVYEEPDETSREDNLMEGGFEKKLIEYCKKSQDSSPSANEFMADSITDPDLNVVECINASEYVERETVECDNMQCGTSDESYLQIKDKGDKLIKDTDSATTNTKPTDLIVLLHESTKLNLSRQDCLNLPSIDLPDVTVDREQCGSPEKQPRTDVKKCDLGDLTRDSVYSSTEDGYYLRNPSHESQESLKSMESISEDGVFEDTPRAQENTIKLC